jgi:hypothetical protein
MAGTSPAMTGTCGHAPLCKKMREPEECPQGFMCSNDFVALTVLLKAVLV